MRAVFLPSASASFYSSAMIGNGYSSLAGSSTGVDHKHFVMTGDSLGSHKGAFCLSMKNDMNTAPWHFQYNITVFALSPGIW